MSTTLTTNTFYGILPSVSAGGTGMAMQTAQATSFVMVEPIGYEFQVVEYMEGDRIAKVALQVKRNIHDQYGNIKTHGIWMDVPRIKIPYVAPVV
jgi:hypothetical protein